LSLNKVEEEMPWCAKQTKMLNQHISVSKYQKVEGNKFTTYHKPSHLCGIMNRDAFWSDFSEKQNGNLV